MSIEPFDISKYESGTFLFAGTNDDLSIEQAKEYIEKNNIDKSLIKLIRYTVTLENGESEKIIAVIIK